MKALLEYLPIVLFFPVYLWYGMFWAVGVAVAASLIQLAWIYGTRQRPETMQLVSIGAIVLFGSVTLILQDKQFFMWKPTLINVLFALAFVGVGLFSQRPAVQHLLGSQLRMPDLAWTRLNTMWIVYFLIGAVANWLVARRFFAAEQALVEAGPALDREQINALECSSFEASLQALCTQAVDAEQFWTSFKVFGLIGLTVVFIIVQGVYIAKNVQTEEEPK